ncbi:MAG: hypothetical protein ACOX4U_02660 [Anaerovoracaceae bacterium]|jgi:hypothetical protein
MKINSIRQVSGNSIIDEGELVVAITAAIIASGGSGFESKLQVKRIRRVLNERPAWNQAGLNDIMVSRMR